MSNRTEECEDCGDEIESWRQPHTDKCPDCGHPRCRGCGIAVDAMDTTSDGGYCIPCSRERLL